MHKKQSRPPISKTDTVGIDEQGLQACLPSEDQLAAIDGEKLRPFMATRCAIYTRTDPGVVDPQAPTSCERQREAILTYIARRWCWGWTVLCDSYDDRECSADSLERPQLKRMLADIRRDKIDCVIVSTMDRLTNSAADRAILGAAFSKYTVKLATVAPEVIHVWNRELNRCVHLPLALSPDAAACRQVPPYPSEAMEAGIAIPPLTNLEDAVAAIKELGGLDQVKQLLLTMREARSAVARLGGMANAEAMVQSIEAIEKR